MFVFCVCVCVCRGGGLDNEKQKVFHSSTCQARRKCDSLINVIPVGAFPSSQSVMSHPKFMDISVHISWSFISCSMY